MNIMDVAYIKNSASAMAGEMTALRRHLHAHPEISWEETETTRLIASKLEEIGFRPKVGFGGKETGVTADLECGEGEGKKPCIALRADIDALPISEENDLDYKSRRAGAMHACGHDAHAAMLLSAAKILHSLKDSLHGRIRFIFQPAEEHGVRSGAKVMIEEGVLDGVDAIAGMHVWSYVPTGRVQWRAGPVMACADKWRVRFQGKGGHGAVPHKAVDPLVIAANFILALQTIVSREIDPLETSVVSVGKIVSGEAINVIPDSAEMIGNVRSFNPEISRHAREAFSRLAENIASAYRGSAEVDYNSIFPFPVNNDRDLTNLFREVAVRIVGEERVEESPMLMTSEDFSYYQSRIPGILFFLGAGSAEKGTDAPHHSPRFNLDEDALPTGVSLLASFACAALEHLRNS
jgi:amidohydrolase